jgi:hypothetical protein
MCVAAGGASQSGAAAAPESLQRIEKIPGSMSAALIPDRRSREVQVERSVIDISCDAAYND